MPLLIPNETDRSTIEFGSNEEGQAITRFESGESSFFAVGTAITGEGAVEPEKGRLALFRQTETQEFVQIAETAINGCPFAIVDAGNSSLALAVNSQVSNKVSQCPSCATSLKVLPPRFSFTRSTFQTIPSRSRPLGLELSSLSPSPGDLMRRS